MSGTMHIRQDGTTGKHPWAVGASHLSSEEIRALVAIHTNKANVALAQISSRPYARDEDIDAVRDLEQATKRLRVLRGYRGIVAIVPSEER